jgi:hypothetical protein
MTEIKPGKYRHYKGKDYEVIGIAKAKDFGDPNTNYVIYRPLDIPRNPDDTNTYLRTLENFLETVNVDGKEVKRFEYIGK